MPEYDHSAQLESVEIAQRLAGGRQEGAASGSGEDAPPPSPPPGTLPLPHSHSCRVLQSSLVGDCGPFWGQHTYSSVSCGCTTPSSVLPRFKLLEMGAPP